MVLVDCKAEEQTFQQLMVLACILWSVTLEFKLLWEPSQCSGSSQTPVYIQRRAWNELSLFIASTNEYSPRYLLLWELMVAQEHLFVGQLFKISSPSICVQSHFGIPSCYETDWEHPQMPSSHSSEAPIHLTFFTALTIIFHLTLQRL